MSNSTITLLNGPMGTELAIRGLDIPAPLWSAHAIVKAPHLISAIHHDYALAGATVHTTNTFRTKRRQAGDAWLDLLVRAVNLCRQAVPKAHKVAGSLTPLEDCYRPDLSPSNPRPEHRESALALANAGVDLILCETFPHVGEALIAVEEAVATGRPVWVSFTAGPEANLLSLDEVRSGAKEAVLRGVQAVLINCVPASATLPYIRQLANLGVPFGAYANAGHVSEGLGWMDPANWEAQKRAAQTYANMAKAWIEAGATLVGGCCGTGPEHIAALAALIKESSCTPL